MNATQPAAIWMRLNQKESALLLVFTLGDEIVILISELNGLNAFQKACDVVPKHDKAHH